MFTCSGRRRERNLFTISPAAENTLSDGTDAALYIVIKKFLQSGSDRFPRRDSKLGLYKLHKSSKILSFYKADRKHIFSDKFSDVGRGLLCPSSIRLRCPDHETSHWLLLTCGWTSWVLRSQMIVHCSGWPMISKPRTAEFALHFIHFYQSSSRNNSYLTLSKVFVNRYDTQVCVGENVFFSCCLWQLLGALSVAPPSGPSPPHHHWAWAWHGAITLVKRTGLWGSDALGHGSKRRVWVHL